MRPISRKQSITSRRAGRLRTSARKATRPASPPRRQPRLKVRMKDNSATYTVDPPPPRTAHLRCERGEGLGVGALSSFSVHASAPPPLAPPHKGEGNAPR